MSRCGIVIGGWVMPMKVQLLHKSKLVLNSGLVREVVIWSVPASKFYPEGIKYKLLLADPFWKKTLVLLDNHASKGHHGHDSKGNEYIYNFISVKLLVEDFFGFELYEEWLYECTKNNED